MDWGMQSRMARLIPPETGKAFFLAIDHGYFLGPTRSLERPGETVADLTPDMLDPASPDFEPWVSGVSSRTVRVNDELSSLQDLDEEEP